uniref:Cytochrome P450 n=1 Tax=Plectus sambesii TaxID=2011161 RepID=A0A914W8C6_9BILA
MLVGLVFASFIAYFFFHHLYGKRRNLPPGPTPWPVFGNIFHLDAKYPDRQLVEWKKIYGPVFTVWLPGPMVIVADYDVMKETFVKQGEPYSGRPNSVLNNELYRGNYGLFFATGLIWKENRRFTLHVLRDFGFGRNTLEPLVMEQARELVSELHKTTKPINIRDPFLTAMGNVINMLVFGFAFKFEDQRLMLFKDIFEEYSRIFSSNLGMLVEICPWLRHLDQIVLNIGWKRLMTNYQRVFDYIKQEIDEHRRTLDADQPPRDYADAYLMEMEKRTKAGEGDLFTDWQMTTTIHDLWSAGFETTVTTLQCGILLLLNNPSVQEKLHEEIDRVIGREQELSMDDQQRLPYLCATVQELQRAANIVPLSVQHTVTDDVIINGHRIPKGTTVIPQTASLHSDPELFHEPEKFRPERFIDDTSGHFIRSEHVLPFSLGKRACVGEHLARMELFLFLGTLMQRCEFRPVDENRPPPIDYIPGLARSPVPFLCIVSPRRPI